MCVPQGNQSLHGVQKGIRILCLILDRRGIRRRILRQVDGGRIRIRESVIGPVAPLHRRAGAGTEISALFGRQVQIAHADFIAVVQERYARHGEQERVEELQLVIREAVSEADRVMVAGDQADIAVLLCPLQHGSILRRELRNGSAGILLEVAVILICGRGLPISDESVSGLNDPVGMILIIPDQCAEGLIGIVQNEIHVETGRQCLLRAAPLGDKGGLRVFRVEHGAHIPPDRAGSALFLVIPLDQRVRHVHTEAVQPQIQPEADDIFECLDGGNGVRIVRGGLPGLGLVEEAVVQCRLALEEIDHVRGTALRLACDDPVSVHALEAEV